MGFIRVRGLGKAYKWYRTRWGRLAEWFGAAPRHDLTWVLRDFNFDIAPGEAVGIVGPNGAGKSTLLKLITGTVRPTAGSYEAGGAVAALLELGIGFHPEFTGRENVRMAGHLQGIPGDHLEEIIRAVEAFAEIGDYFDRPLRIYSTGMQVRLAFGIATAVRPDVLIVDEALSVGDIYFQQKCYDRIRSFRDAGTTLLLVTHSLATVYSICTRAFYIESGRLQLDASPKEAIDLYQARVIARAQEGRVNLAVVGPQAISSAGDTSPSSSPTEAGVRDRADVGTAPLERASGETGDLMAAASRTATSELPLTPTETGSYFSAGVSIESVRLLDQDGRATETFFSHQLMAIEVTGRFADAFSDAHFGFQIRDRLGQAIYMTTTHGLGTTIGPVAQGALKAVRFQLRPRVSPGQYTVTAGIANRGRFDGTFEQSLVRYQDVATFTVIDAIDAPRWVGIADLQATVESIG